MRENSVVSPVPRSTLSAFSPTDCFTVNTLPLILSQPGSHSVNDTICVFFKKSALSHSKVAFTQERNTSVVTICDLIFSFLPELGES